MLFCSLRENSKFMQLKHWTDFRTFTENVGIMSFDAIISADFFVKMETMGMSIRVNHNWSFDDNSLKIIQI